MSPDGHLDDERSRRVERLLASSGPATPPALRIRLAALQTGRPAATRRRSTRLVAAIGATALVAFVAVLTLTIDGGAPTGPTLADAARPSARAATAPSPAHDLRSPALLRASFAGVTYPYWYKQFNWFAAGQRSDSLGDGRTARTVFYRHTHHRIGYTVVSGTPLMPPRAAERRVINGVEIRGYRDGSRDVVTFVRNGHTCVLAGVVHSRGTLYKLAAWNGDGTLRFR